MKFLIVALCAVVHVESAKQLRTKPVRLTDLENYIATMDSNDGFKAEFESLGDPTTQLQSWDYASLPQNLPKHRYPPPEDHLLTYDATRVVLKKLRNDQHSDFINANWIDNYALEQTYIATQCPIESTINDFWRTVWEHNVHEVVALASPHDIEKKKCAKYFPEDQATYGGVQIYLERKEEYPDIVVRIYSLRVNETVRVFVHHHFVSWPDLGVPNDPQQLLDLILKYRTSDTYTKAWPLLVHCSAGVGRTGTFLLTDAMFEMARETGRVDFLAHLAHIRNQRISVVEKPEQYRLAHLVILEAYKQGYFDKNNNNLKYTPTTKTTTNDQRRTGHFISNNKGTNINTPWTHTQQNNNRYWSNKKTTVNAHVDHQDDGDIVIRITKEPRVPIACAA